MPEGKEYTITHEIRQRLHKILDLVLDLNQGPYTTWFEFSGHVNGFGVRLINGDWSEKKVNSGQFSVDFYHLEDPDWANTETSYTIKRLMNLLKKDEGEDHA